MTERTTYILDLPAGTVTMRAPRWFSNRPAPLSRTITRYQKGRDRQATLRARAFRNRSRP